MAPLCIDQRIPCNIPAPSPLPPVCGRTWQPIGYMLMGVHALPSHNRWTLLNRGLQGGESAVCYFREAV